MELWSALKDLFRQCVQLQNVDGGYNLHLSLPDQIELTSGQGLQLWLFIHVAYALITHLFCIRDVRRFNGTITTTSDAIAKPKLVSNTMMWVVFLVRMLFGLEFKIANAIWVVFIRLFCNIIAPLVQGNSAAALKQALIKYNLYSLRWRTPPSEW
jgi:hypothetical protein